MHCYISLSLTHTFFVWKGAGLNGEESLLQIRILRGGLLRKGLDREDGLLQIWILKGEARWLERWLTRELSERYLHG